MSKRRFDVSFSVEMEIELDDQVIDVVDDEWRKSFYDLYTPEDIAEHVAWCLLRGWSLSSMDGWADQPSSNARVLDEDYYDVEIKEISNDNS